MTEILGFVADFGFCRNTEIGIHGFTIAFCIYFPAD